MIECPYCTESELIGAIFCRKCGSQIMPGSFGLAPKSKGNNPSIQNKPARNIPPVDAHYPDNTDQPGSANQYPPTGEPPPPVTKFPAEIDGKIVLQVQQTGQFIPIMEEDELTLGRAGVGQPIIPDIDLTPYQGLEGGVSRLHASIRIKNGEVYIMDLGSANGTRLNGEKLSPSTPYQVDNESIITLGKLNLKVLIKS